MTEPAKSEAWPAALRLHQLEGFFYVARHEGYARAVRAMPYAITEPALHQQVRKLEAALGGLRLLEKAPGRRMGLTPPGRLLYNFVAPYFEGLGGVLRVLMAGAGGTLYVACEPLYVDELVAPAMALCSERQVNATLHLHELDGAAMVEAVVRGAVDLGISLKPAQKIDSVVFEELGVLGFELLLPAAHPWCERSSLPPVEELNSLRCVVYPEGTKGRRFTDQAFELAGVKPGVVAEATSAAAMRSLVRAGVGPAFVPALRSRGSRAERRERLAGVVALDVTQALATVTDLPRFGVIRRPGAAALTRAFIELLKEILGE